MLQHGEVPACQVARPPHPHLTESRADCTHSRPLMAACSAQTRRLWSLAASCATAARYYGLGGCLRHGTYGKPLRFTCGSRGKLGDSAVMRRQLIGNHGRGGLGTVVWDALPATQPVPAVTPLCASSPTPPPPSSAPLSHMHINMQHTLSCSLSLSVPSARRSSLTISGMVLSSRWTSSRPDAAFCPWLLPRVCEADDDAADEDWGLLSCHR